MDLIKWAKEYWALLPIYLIILSTFSISILNLSTNFLALPAILGALLAVRYKRTLVVGRKYWASIFVIAIVMFAFHVRILDYRWPYLRNIDSYMFYRHMDYIVQNNGVMPERDQLILAPNGWPIRHELFPWQYLGAYTFMFTRLIFPELQLWQLLIYLPALVASLAAIPMYYIGKILYDKKAGVLAALFTVFDFSNLSRSLGGDPDTDAIVILVPLIVMALFLFTYKHINNNGLNKRSIIYSIITGIAMALWAHTWEGYWYALWLITAMISIKIIIFATRHKQLIPVLKEAKPLIVSYVILLVILFMLTYPAYGVEKFQNFLGPFKFQQLKSEEGIEFPNVYVSVAELQGGDPGGIIQRTSAIDFGAAPLLIFLSPFFLMVYALAYLMYSFYRKRQHIDTLILLLVWFVGPFMATTVAIRFSTLFSAPIAIGSAIFLAKIINMVAHKEKLED